MVPAQAAEPPAGPRLRDTPVMELMGYLRSSETPPSVTMPPPLMMRTPV